VHGRLQVRVVLRRFVRQFLCQFLQFSLSHSVGHEVQCLCGVRMFVMLLIRARQASSRLRQF
jgi:hypothetical protein